jgi:formylglycine-generating enzyme required for sulfatase activity
MADIFLSYAREDEPRARALAGALGSRGWSIFWDRRIPKGRDFREHLQQQLDSAGCIVVLWSRASIKSGFVIDEATEGFKNQRLVPALIEAVSQPLGFRGIEAADLTEWPNDASRDEFEELVSSIGQIVPPSVQSVAATSVAEVAVPAVTEVERTIKSPSNAAYVRADITSFATEPAPPPAAIGRRRVERLERIKKIARQPIGRAAAAFVLLGIALFGILWWVYRTPTATSARSSDPSGASANANAGTPAHSNSPADIASSPQAEVTKNARPSVADNPAAWMPAFVEVPAGLFTMGSNKAKDLQADDDELPQHQVTLPTFFIARDEVTVRQFKACAGEGGCKPSDDRSLAGPEDLPVRFVSWHEAIAYCAWLQNKLISSPATPADLANALEGRREGRAWHVTLPSEAEWEKAARGTDGRTYPWGDTIDPAKANYYETKRGGPTAAGSFPGDASPYGVQDMSGNVLEWTRSHYRPYPYRPADGRENLNAGDDIRRAVRGGSFDHPAREVRVADRGRRDPDNRLSTLGFRVVVTPFQP